MSEPSPGLRKTPLHSLHRQLGARLVAFAGWEMPVDYGSVISEHLAVRNAAGLFDVSHMGEITVEGAGAVELLQRLTPNDVSKLAPGQAHYSALTTERGTFVDDLLVYRQAPSRFLLVVNASNIEKDFAWIQEHSSSRAEVRNRSDDFALLALQGPRAEEILARLTALELEALKYFHFTESEVAGQPVMVSRTGYTGEDGFEILVAAERAEPLWQRVLEAGAGSGLKPAGLGARDTLRLEAKLPLYGNDIDEEHTVLEADLGWIVKLQSPEKGDFLGRAALERQKREGITRRLVGFELVERGIARHGYPVFAERGSEPVSQVTSGSHAPFLERSIGLAYLPRGQDRVGIEFEIGVRGQRLRALVVATPFYKRPAVRRGAVSAP
jgi:aminomethyltransferase